LRPAGPSEQAGISQHGGVQILLLQLAQAGVDVPPQVYHPEIVAVPQKLGAAPEAAGADKRPSGQLIQLFAPAGNQHVGRVFPLAHGTYDQAFGQFGGQVLHAVHRHVDFPAQHGRFQFFSKKALISYFNKGRVKDTVAQGTDSYNPEAATGAELLQAVYHPPGLPHGQLAYPGAHCNLPLHTLS